MTTERDELAKCGAELDKAMRGAKTLGEIIEKQCRDVLDVTGLHHLINEDGDGAWDVVWFRLFEMRDELAGLKESTIGRERLRGDSWRDRAQEMEVLRDAAVERAEAALSERDRHVISPEAVEAARVKLEDVLGGWFDDLDAIRQILEAAAPYMHAYLLAELRDRDEKLARVEYVCADRAELADGDKYYASKVRAAVAAANGGRVVTLDLFPKHPDMDAYRVGGAYQPYAVVAVDKRFTDAELAAEWHQQDKYTEQKLDGYTTSHDGYPLASEETEQQRLAILNHLATLPHYDE